MAHKIYSRRLSSIVFFIFIGSDLVTGISMRNASIPHYGVKDGRVTLVCDFDLESDKLLNLKWYKDESEFFRYASNNVQVFPVEGVNVDVVHSSQKVVTLKNITLQTSGVFRCEVVAEKSFQRITHQGQIIVVAPPLTDPDIVIQGDLGNQSRVSIGDRVIGNCTSYRSKPPASLMLYINGQKADYGDITEYTPVNEPGGLETSTLGFNFLIESNRFPRPTSKVELKCTASIGNHYRVSVRELHETKITAQPSSKRNSEFPSSSPGSGGVPHPLFLSFLAISRTFSCKP